MLSKAVHACGQLILRQIKVTAEHTERRIDRGIVILLGGSLPASAHALPDLIIDAGAPLADVGGKLSFAPRNTERFFQRINDVVRDARAGIRSEILCTVGSARPRHHKARIFLPGRHLDIRIGLCILQKDIIARVVLLDQYILQRERLHLGVTEIEIKILHRTDHLLGLDILFTVLKILRNAVLQLGGFADIDDRAGGVFHDIDAGAQRQGVCLVQETLPRRFSVFHAVPPSDC